MKLSVRDFPAYDPQHSGIGLTAESTWEVWLMNLGYLEIQKKGSEVVLGFSKDCTPQEIVDGCAAEWGLHDLGELREKIVAARKIDLT